MPAWLVLLLFFLYLLEPAIATYDRLCGKSLGQQQQQQQQQCFPPSPGRRLIKSSSSSRPSTKARPLFGMLHRKLKPIIHNACDMGRHRSLSSCIVGVASGTVNALTLTSNLAMSAIIAPDDPSTQQQSTDVINNGEAIKRAFYFWTNAGPMIVHYKCTQWYLEFCNASQQKRFDTYEILHNRYSQPSLDIILHLKGLYVKIGQVLSSRPDFIPRQYVELFSTVQDSIPPWDDNHIERLVRDSIKSSLPNLDLEDVFESIGEVLGSASIGQVHRAVLKEPWNRLNCGTNNKVVAIKVMHPDAKIRFTHDFSVFKWLCKLVLPQWKPLLVELERQMMTEFDYRTEAASLEEVRYNMNSSPYAKRIHIPQPIMPLSSKHLLVMEMIEGTKLVDTIEEKLANVAFGGNLEEAKSFLQEKRRELFLGKDENTHRQPESEGAILPPTRNSRKNGWNVFIQKPKSTIQLLSLYKQVRGYIDLLLDVHGYQILINGCFNGDPHAGNILVMPDGRLGLIDYGQTRRLADKDRLAIARIIATLGDGSAVHNAYYTNANNSTTATLDISNAMRDFGFQTKLNNDDVLSKYATLFFDSDIEGKKLGFATPQLYIQYLSSLDPIVHVPDPAVFVARTSFLFRGMGAMLEAQLHTARRWSNHARDALAKSDSCYNKEIVKR